jgi:diacylglycerol kinase family enzyme
VNAVMRLPDDVRRATVVGAIALGSSNDFHKPLACARRVAGIPVLLDSERAVARDVGVLELLDRPAPRRHFVLSASVGIVANGNRAYNDAGWFLRAAKRSTTGVALAYATARTLVSTPTLAARLTFGEAVTHMEITNASFLLSPFVSGSLRYDVSAPPDDEELAVALCGPMGLVRRLRTLAALARGRFLGLPGTTVLRAERIGVELDTPVAVELDGEILSARAFRIRRLRKAVNVCS